MPPRRGVEPHPRGDPRRQIVDLALDAPDLSPWESAVTFTDTKDYSVSEASVYRLLKGTWSRLFIHSNKLSA